MGDWVGKAGQRFNPAGGSSAQKWPPLRENDPIMIPQLPEDEQHVPEGGV